MSLLPSYFEEVRAGAGDPGWHVHVGEEGGPELTIAIDSARAGKTEPGLPARREYLTPAAVADPLLGGTHTRRERHLVRAGHRFPQRRCADPLGGEQYREPGPLNKCPASSTVVSSGAGSHRSPRARLSASPSDSGIDPPAVSSTRSEATPAPYRPRGEITRRVSIGTPLRSPPGPAREPDAQNAPQVRSRTTVAEARARRLRGMKR